MANGNIFQRTYHKLTNNEFFDSLAAIRADIRASACADGLAEGIAEGRAIARAEARAKAYAIAYAEGRAELIQELIALTPPDATPEYREWLEQLARNNPANR